LVYIPKNDITSGEKPYKNKTICEEDPHKPNTVAFVHSQAKILGIHSAASVPTLEMLVAQLNTKFTKYFKEFFEDLYQQPVEMVLTADSCVVLVIMRASALYFGLRDHILRRALELQSASEIGQWCYCPGKSHGVDFATKVHPDILTVLQDVGWRAAFFLEEPREQWPLIANSDSLSKMPTSELLKKELGWTDNVGQRGQKSGLEVIAKEEQKQEISAMQTSMEQLGNEETTLLQGELEQYYKQLPFAKRLTYSSPGSLHNTAPTTTALSKGKMHTRRGGEYYCQVLPRNVEAAITNINRCQPAYSGDTYTCIQTEAITQDNSEDSHQEEEPSLEDNCMEDRFGDNYYLEPNGLKATKQQFVRCEFMGYVLGQTDNIEGLLTGLAKAICIFLRNSKKEEWQKAEENIYSVKQQIFCKLIQCLIEPAWTMVHKHANLKARTLEDNNIIYTIPRLTQDQAYSNEQVVIP
jgi:hypothetical protein